MSSTKIELTGQTFGQLTVLSFTGKDKHREANWFCKCNNCYNFAVVTGRNLRKGNVKSCGCIRREYHTKHGEYKSSEYSSWLHMKRRCYNSKDKRFSQYGGRGIKITERWLGKYGFENFLVDMGKKPTSKHSLDRIDCNRGYEPSNCRWATYSEQNINQRLKSNNKYGKKGVHQLPSGKWRAYITVDGKTYYKTACETFEQAVYNRKNLELEHWGFTDPYS